MKRHVAVLAALAIAFTTLLAPANAKPGGGGGGGARPAGGAARPAPQRPSGGAARPAAPARPAGGGFNLKGDTKPQPPANRAPNKPAAKSPSNNTGNRPGGNGNGNNNGNRPGGNGNNNNNGNRPGGNNNNNNNGNRNNGNINISGNTINRTVVANPVYGGTAWGWNHGVAWYPAPAYYGGGFWGAMAIGVTSAAVFGAVVNSTNNQTYTSYQVQPSSPGATVLSNYHLTQTQCGGGNLVVMYGPNNSVVCAFPNDLVAAGNYNLDTTTLSLTSL